MWNCKECDTTNWDSARCCHRCQLPRDGDSSIPLSEDKAKATASQSAMNERDVKEVILRILGPLEGAEKRSGSIALWFLISFAGMVAAIIEMSILDSKFGCIVIFCLVLGSILAIEIVSENARERAFKLYCKTFPRNSVDRTLADRVLFSLEDPKRAVKALRKKIKVKKSPRQRETLPPSRGQVTSPTRDFTVRASLETGTASVTTPKGTERFQIAQVSRFLLHIEPKPLRVAIQEGLSEGSPELPVGMWGRERFGPIPGFLVDELIGKDYQFWCCVTIHMDNKKKMIRFDWLYVKGLYQPSSRDIFHSNVTRVLREVWSLACFADRYFGDHLEICRRPWV